MLRLFLFLPHLPQWPVIYICIYMSFVIYNGFQDSVNFSIKKDT